MEPTHTEGQGTAAARSFDLDAMGLGPPTKVRRRGKVDKWTRVLGVAVVLLLVFNIGVRMGHASRPKAAPPAGGSGAPAAGRAGAEAPKPTATGTVKIVDGNAIYVGQPDGTTRKVVANDSTRFTRTVPAGLRDIQPGDRVTVEGPSQPDGTVNAIRIDGQAATLQQG
jgi:hypothetical protein